MIDVFYIEGVFHGGQAKRAVSYIKSNNQTGNPEGHNFTVMNTAIAQSPFTLGHEIMHILLDSVHRDQGAVTDPGSALFFNPTSSTNGVTGTKRIGPNASTDPANAAGDSDTFDIRVVAETLP